MLIVDSQLAIAAGWEAHLSAARGVVGLRVCQPVVVLTRCPSWGHVARERCKPAVRSLFLRLLPPPKKVRRTERQFGSGQNPHIPRSFKPASPLHLPQTSGPQAPL